MIRRYTEYDEGILDEMKHDREFILAKGEIV